MPIYNLDNLTGNLDLIFQNIMQVFFIIAISFIVFWILLSLCIWLFGARRKSEKAIKFGIRNFIISVVMMIIVLIIPIVINSFNKF